MPDAAVLRSTAMPAVPGQVRAACGLAARVPGRPRLEAGAAFLPAIEPGAGASAHFPGGRSRPYLSAQAERRVR